MPADTQHASLTRKLIHIAMSILSVIGWWISYALALALAGLLCLASLTIEIARHWWPWLNGWLWRLLPTTFRPWEGRGLLGSTWFSLGAAATLLLYGQDVGGTALLYLCWGDPAAELVGRRWGGGGEGKTLAGSLGCLAACLLAGFVGLGLGGLSLWAVLVGAFVATLVERWPPPPDDNLWMPLLSGLAVVIVQSMLGGHTVLFPLWH